MNMKIDKQNGNIAFAEAEHCYWDVTNDNKFISVTTLIEKFAQPFDKAFWSKYKSLEKLLPPDAWKIEKKNLLNTHKIPDELLSTYDISELDLNKAQQDILDEWDKTNRESCERGTKIHAELENSMYKMGSNVSLKKFGVGGKFICDKGRTTLDLENGVYPEYLISRTSPDGMLRIAGQIDLLVKKGKEIWVLDYKTNKEIKQKAGFNTQTRSEVKMLYPLNGLPDSNYWHYAMQLSTYAWMIQMIDPEYTIKDLIIIHFDHNDNQTIYHMPYLKKEVEAMLKFYKKSIFKQEKLAKLKHIEY